MKEMKEREDDRRTEEPDMLMALMLERKKAAGITYAALAAGAGVSECTLRRMFRKSPWDWDRASRRRICALLGIGEDLVRRAVRL